MKLPAQAHVAIADGTRFLLMRNTGTATEPALELAAEPDVSETGESGAVGHNDPRGDDYRTQEKLDRAAGIAGWLNGQVLEHRIEQLLIVADPDTLGEMRKHYRKETEGALIGELDKQVTGMPGPEILRVIEAA
ncbi:MAG: host attachment protein [Qipengyuania sp.]|nr:host attachment protein [Qipengyuania sp.]